MDIDAFAKSACETLSEGAFNNLFTNPIYVATLITTSLMLIVLTMYDEQHIIKSGVYMFLMSLFIVFIHNKLLLIEHRKALCDKDSDNICKVIEGGIDNNTGGAATLSYLTM